MKTCRALTLVVITSALLLECQGNKQGTGDVSARAVPGQSARADVQEPSAEAVGLFSQGFSSFKPVAAASLAGTTDALVLPGHARASAHSRYLDESPTFEPIPEVTIEGEGKVVVIGSTVAKFFPKASISTNEDLSKLGSGEPIPLGTLLAVGDPLNAKDEQYDGLFNYEDEYNYFYPTIFRGVGGLVFGADLYGLNDTAPRNTIAAFLYKLSGRRDSFFPVYGLEAVPESLQARLATERIAFERVKPDSYELSYENPDDMVSLYQQDAWDTQRCVFITTDLISHALHLVFDRLLQTVEEEHFAPKLGLLIDAYRAEIDASIAADDGSIPEYSRTLAMARLYFEVPRAILEAAPSRRVREVEPMEYIPRSKEEIYAKYSPEARKILGLIDAHTGWETIPEFAYKEDFSQYKPRGHYTRNGILGAYFMAMMWFGRVHMYVAVADPPPLVWHDNDDTAAFSATELSLQLTPVAVLLSDITASVPGLVARWRQLFDPLTWLIGVSDDLSYYDLMPFLEEQGIADLAAWTADEQGILGLVRAAGRKLRSPLIAGNAVKQVPSGPDLAPPMGFRLFGQRFTYDSAVHQQTSGPRLQDLDPSLGRSVGRGWVAGLDIMAAFGSDAAVKLLESWSNGYVKFPSMRPVIEGFRTEFSGYKPEFWGTSYYNRALFLVKAQAQFEQGSGFYFTETPLWNVKSLISAHGTWAELRHDTILYAKQVYGGAEMGGFLEPSFRTQPPPLPTNYIEPNLPFFTGARLMVRDLCQKAASFGILPESYAGVLESFDALLGTTVRIVRDEVSDSAISADDNRFIRSIPEKLSQIVRSMEYNEGEADPEELKMAIVADVYTHVDNKKVLEVGVGIPNRIWLLLSDGQGGKRIARGYTFSYYEFYHPMDDRLTDEQWRKVVYDASSDLSKYEPFWEAGVVR